MGLKNFSSSNMSVSPKDSRNPLKRDSLMEIGPVGESGVSDTSAGDSSGGSADTAGSGAATFEGISTKQNDASRLTSTGFGSAAAASAASPSRLGGASRLREGGFTFTGVSATDNGSVTVPSDTSDGTDTGSDGTDTDDGTGGGGGSVTDNTVFSYDATAYDSEIINRGVTSAFPEVLAILPMQNLYRSGELTNTGILYEIQNSIKDSTIKRADQIVNDYYAAFPDVATSLAAIRDENNSKYNNVISLLSQIIQYRQEIVNVLGGNPTANEVKTFFAGSASDYYFNFYSDYGHSVAVDDLVSYVDEENPLSTIEKKLIGFNSQQSNTAKQYQMLRAAIAQITDGRLLTESALSDFGSYPYSSLDDSANYIQSVSVTSFLAGNISPASIDVAKDTLELAGQTIYSGGGKTGYTPPSEYRLRNESQINDYYSDRKLFYAGDIIVNDDSTYDLATQKTIDDALYFYPNSKISSWYLVDNDDESTYIANLPIVGINIADITSDFIKQGFLSLGAEIAQQFRSLSLPSSINPSGGNVDITSTSEDQVRFIVKTSDGKNLFLFDESLTDETSFNGRAISTVLQSSTTELEYIKGQIESIQDDFYTFLTDSAHVLVNEDITQILTKIIYDKISEQFANSALNGQKDDESSLSDCMSAIRIAMFTIAANNNVAAGKLFRVIDDPNNNIVRKIAGGGTAEIEDVGNAIMDFLGYADGAIILSEGAATTSDEGDFSGESLTTDGKSMRLGASAKIQSFGPSSITIKDFVTELFDSGGSFFKFQQIVDEVIARFVTAAGVAAVESGSPLAKKIKYFSYIFFLYLLKKVNITGNLLIGSSEDDLVTTDYDENLSVFYSGKIKWYPPDALFIADCLTESHQFASTDEMSFSNFSSYVGATPTEEQFNVAGAEFFSRIREPIRYFMQAFYDFKGLSNTQYDILQDQVNAIKQISTLMSSFESYLGDDADKASLITSRYLSLESVVEALYRSKRYQTVVPGTGISAIARRSKHYRSVVKTAFRELIPDSDDLKICIIGIPYGHLERLRLAQTTRTFYFSAQVNFDDVSTEDDEELRVDYPFDYISSSEEYRPKLAGPFAVLTPELYDDFESTSTVRSKDDSSISIYRMLEDGSTMEILTRDEASQTFRLIDFPATIVQAALQSYVEDVYGLYPRFASTKVDMQTTPYPEEAFADLALQYAGIARSNTDEELIYERLKSTIMMHKDFITSRMFDEFVASPLFDKIIYMLVDTTDSDVVSEFYVKLEV